MAFGRKVIKNCPIVALTGVTTITVPPEGLACQVSSMRFEPLQGVQ